MLDKMSQEPDALICQGTIGSFRTIPSRGVCSFTVESPIEQLELVARIASHGSWVAVARIQEPAKQPETKEKKRWDDLSPAQQAGILCADPEFQEFVGEKDEGSAITEVYMRCNVNSRAEIAGKESTLALWKDLVNSFRVWQQARP